MVIPWNTIITTIVGIIITVFTGFLSHRVQKLSDQNHEYRKEREEKEEAEAERQRLRNEANDQLTLGMARTMLLTNYEKCITKGYYTVAQREVYHKLYEAYRQDNGNGVIEQIAEKIIHLPTEPPVDQKD